MKILKLLIIIFALINLYVPKTVSNELKQNQTKRGETGQIGVKWKPWAQIERNRHKKAKTFKINFIDLQHVKN